MILTVSRFFHSWKLHFVQYQTSSVAKDYLVKHTNYNAIKGHNSKFVTMLLLILFLKLISTNAPLKYKV